MSGDGVVLLHGIWRSATSMRRLDRALGAAGYTTLNLDYASRRHDVRAHARDVENRVMPWAATRAGQVHFETHCRSRAHRRAAATQSGPRGHARSAEPRQRARRSSGENGDLPISFRPSGADLTTRRAPDLGFVDYPLGIVAGNRSLDPVSWLVPPKPNDGKVSVARTKVEGMTDHIVPPANHTFMMNDATVIQMTLAILSDGHFGARA